MTILAKKLLVYFFLLIIGICVAGAYGALHNQISYTVSPEYFTEFKFYQFGISDSQIPARIRASLVGFLASWWMGVPIGFLVGIVGFIHRDHRRMLAVSLQAIGVAVIFTLLFGLCGLIYGFVQTSNLNINDYQYWYIPADVVNVRRFLCAGYMHNSAYLGGLLSVPIAWTYHLLLKFRAVNR